MTYRLITPPAALAVSMEAAKLSLRIDGADLDASIELWIKGIAAEAEHQIGRALISQDWRLTLDSFPDAIALANPPIVSVASVKFYDTDNVLQTLDPADYFLDAATEPGYIVPAVGKTWPATYDKANAVTVDYTCGYGATEASIPEGVKLYILARLGQQFDSAAREFRETEQSMYIVHLLDRFKVYG